MCIFYGQIWVFQSPHTLCILFPFLNICWQKKIMWYFQQWYSVKWWMMWKVNLIFPLLVHQKREQIFINHILRSSKNSDTTMLVSIRTICCIILFQSIPVCIVYCECGALLTILKKVIPWHLSFYDFFSNYLVCEWSNSYCTLKKM